MALSLYEYIVCAEVYTSAESVYVIALAGSVATCANGLMLEVSPSLRSNR